METALLFAVLALISALAYSVNPFSDNKPIQGGKTSRRRNNKNHKSRKH